MLPYGAAPSIADLIGKAPIKTLAIAFVAGEGRDRQRRLSSLRRRSARIIERPSLAFVRRLDRPLALDRNSVHDPALALVVVYRVVLDTAVVPERDRIRPPSVATGEFRPYRMLIEPAQQRRALLLGHLSLIGASLSKSGA